jgi:hypothetical protein
MRENQRSFGTLISGHERQLRRLQSQGMLASSEDDRRTTLSQRPSSASALLPAGFAALGARTVSNHRPKYPPGHWMGPPLLRTASAGDLNVRLCAMRAAEKTNELLGPSPSRRLLLQARHAAADKTAATEAARETQAARASLDDEQVRMGVNGSTLERAAPTGAKHRTTGSQRSRNESTILASATNALNMRYSDMFKAFQYVDLDRSGTLSRSEIRRALNMWNVEVDDDKLSELILLCDADGDGSVNYMEFVDALARDTVAPAAMGKRGMQPKEAMGRDDLEEVQRAVKIQESAQV